MPTIHDQLAWEKEMVHNGIERYRRQQDSAVEGNRAQDTSAGSRLLRSYILQVSDHIRLYLDGKHPAGRRRNQYAKLLATLDTDKTALFALKTVINSMYRPQTTQGVCINIGGHIEDELRFARFQVEHKEYYDEIIRSWERKNTTDYKHKKYTLNVKSRDLGMDWEMWPREARLNVGALVISLMMEVCDLVETVRVRSKSGRSDDVYLAPTQQCLDWVAGHNEASEFINPDKMPCLIVPDDWTDWRSGGYYSPEVRARTPLVKVRHNRKDQTVAQLDRADLSKVFTAVNAMQRTGWTVNNRILDVIREVWRKNLGIGMPRSQPYDIPKSPIPEGVKPSTLAEDDPMYKAFLDWKSEAREVHSMEKERIAQNLAVSRVIRMATDMEKHDAFYYVYTLDFRGRIYAATSGLSPQGTDHGKGLLQFAKAKPLGPRGIYWLKVHGANKWGFDKSSSDEQVQWIEDRHEDWLRVAGDPIEHRTLWQDADKPYQFLAFCFEYAQAVEVGADFRSRLPIALDGTCNGLQHFSAMLRDPVGGAAVNLTPAEKPADIYQEVADVCTRKLTGLRALNNEDHGGAVNWLALFADLDMDGMPRKLSKKPVMTLPYGSTQQACTESIYRWTLAEHPDFFEDNTGFRHALYLSPRLWASIGEVVVAARAAMDWIQHCIGVLAKADLPMSYTTPLGFPVYQASYKYTSHQVNTQIGGRLRLRIASDTDELDTRKQRQGSSPNFVHSVDATHLMMCVNAGADAGIEDFAMIHDDFGVHACDTDLWHKIIREEFVRLHTETDLLQSFYDQHTVNSDVTLPPPPAKGDLNIYDVLKSPFFFS